MRADRAVLDVLIGQIRERVARVVDSARSALHAAWRPKGVVGGFVADMTRTRSELLAENAMLRQQLIVAARAVKRPKVHAHERGLFVMLASRVPHWRDALLLVRPETVIARRNCLRCWFVKKQA